MAKQLLQIVAILLIPLFTLAQSKVANYSFGEGGTPQYEHFSFWIKDKQRADITYSYGAERKETVVTYLGKVTYKNQPGFKVQFVNHYLLYIIPKQNQLLVVGSSGKYNKMFSWEYEGPVNGIGTFCDVCTQDEREAMNVLKSAYVK